MRGAHFLLRGGGWRWLRDKLGRCSRHFCPCESEPVRWGGVGLVLVDEALHKRVLRQVGPGEALGGGLVQETWGGGGSEAGHVRRGTFEKGLKRRGYGGWPLDRVLRGEGGRTG
jgi:hypothetical protein